MSLNTAVLTTGERLMRMAAREAHLSVTNLSAEDFALVRDHLSLWLGIIWNFEWWPDTMEREQRYFRDVWAVGTTYSTGDEVYYSEKYYTSLQDANTGNQPDTETAYWSELSAFDRYVGYAQTGKTAFDHALECWSKDPRVNLDAVDLKFREGPSGIEIDDAVTSVFLHYQLRPVRLTGDEYSSTTTYYLGDQVYSTAQGQFYDAVQTSTGQAVTDTAYWTPVKIPAMFEGALIWSAAAEVLQHQRNSEAAKYATARAVYFRDQLTSMQRGKNHPRANSRVTVR